MSDFIAEMTRNTLRGLKRSNKYKAGKITVVHRKVLVGDEQPVAVRYNYKAEGAKIPQDYYIPSKYKVLPEQFRDGRVVNSPLAADANRAVADIIEGLDLALNLLAVRKEEPTVAAVREQYLLGNKAALVTLQLSAGKWLNTNESELETKERELADLQAQVLAKQQEIIELRKRLGTYKEENLVKLVEQMLKSRTRKKDAPSQTKKERQANKKKKASDLSPRTASGYQQMLKELRKWRPGLSIYELDAKTLTDFEQYMVGERYYNNTTKTNLQKLVAICNHFQKEYALGDDYLNYTFTLPLREENVIHLTKEELIAFRNLEIKHVNPLSVNKQNKVKDLALLMAETGLRYMDASLTQDDIKTGWIKKKQQKTAIEVVIPLSERVRGICEKYNWALTGGDVGYWNKSFRKLLSQCDVPSLFVDTTIKNYIGEEEVLETKPKWEHCSAHTLRRTMINQMLLRGKRYDQITKMTGHRDFATFQSYVDRKIDLAELDEVFDYLDVPELTDTPVM
jgi:integrase